MKFIFYCCKQSLTRLYHPSTYPSIQHKTFLHYSANAQNFQHLYHFKLSLVFECKCSKFSISNFTKQMIKIFNFTLYNFMTFSPFLNKQILIFIYKINPHKNFILMYIVTLNLKVGPFLAFLLKILVRQSVTWSDLFPLFEMTKL